MIAVQGHYTDEEMHIQRKGAFLSYNDMSYVIGADYDKINRFLCAVMTAIRCGKYLDLTHTDNNRKILYFVYGESKYKQIQTITKEMAHAVRSRNHGKIKCVSIKEDIEPNEIIPLFRAEIAQFCPQFVFVDNCTPLMKKTAEIENIKDIIPDYNVRGFKFNRILDCVLRENKVTALIGMVGKEGTASFLRKHESEPLHHKYYYLYSYNRQGVELATSGFNAIEVFYHDTLPYPTPMQKGELSKLLLWNWFSGGDACYLGKTIQDIAENYKHEFNCSVSAMKLKINKAIELGIIRKTDLGYEVVSWCDIPQQKEKEAKRKI